MTHHSLAADKPSNLLFVCVDCLRGDAIADGWGDTPFIDSLLDEGLHYTRLFATATTTTPCVASFMTGCYGEHNGVTSLRDAKLNSRVSTLAETFADAGYTTDAMTTGPLLPATDLDRGFDRYRHRTSDQSLFGDWGEIAADRLADLPEPFFCYLHCWELHGPIDVPEAYDTDEYGRWPYERALSALDRALERLAASLPPDTAITLHGDHGESIAWRDSRIHAAAKTARDKLRYEQGVNTRRVERTLNRLFDRFGGDINDHFIEGGHGETVFDHAANVPLVLARPNGSGGRVDTVCRQIDIYPTLLDVMGVSRADHRAIDGETLLPPEEITDRSAYIRACGAALRGQENRIRSVRTADAKYLDYPDRDWSPELYELDRDPIELSPIENPTRQRAMRRRFPALDAVDAERLDIDDHLRDLGYL